MNYLYGYLSAVVVCYVLHLVFPARPLDAFVQQSVDPKHLQEYYNELWETEQGTSMLFNGWASQETSKKSISVTV